MNTSEAAAALGRIKTEKKARASAINAAKARQRLEDPAIREEVNRRRSEAMKVYWAQKEARATAVEETDLLQ